MARSVVSKVFYITTHRLDDTRLDGGHIVEERDVMFTKVDQIETKNKTQLQKLKF